MSNELQMTLVEWIYRMHRAGLTVQARQLAIHAALFDVTGVEELGKICGLEDPRTVRRWKGFLAENGWVIIVQKGGGRGNGVRVQPALSGIPVVLDVKPVNPDTLCKGLERETLPRNVGHFVQKGDKKTPTKHAETPTRHVGECKKSHAFDAGVSNPQKATDNNFARAEVVNIYNKNNIYNLTAREQQTLSDLLVGSCNGALDNPVNCQGLLNLSIPMMWIENDCDLERDILPTLTAIGKAKHGARLRTWKYFSEAVQQARDTRIAGLPTKQQPGGSRSALSAEDTIRQIDAIVRGGR